LVSVGEILDQFKCNKTPHLETYSVLRNHLYKGYLRMLVIGWSPKSKTDDIALCLVT